MPHSDERQLSLHKTICNDCAFHTWVNDTLECTHPDELGVNCYTVIFCNSFQAVEEVDSPCVCFDLDVQDFQTNTQTNTQDHTVNNSFLYYLET